MLTDPADSFLAGANMVAMCHEQHFASWCVADRDDRSIDAVKASNPTKHQPTHKPPIPLHFILFERYVTSARTGSNVEAAFLDLVERAVAFSDQQDKAAAAAGAGAAGASG